MRRPEDGVSNSILPRLFFVYYPDWEAGNKFRQDAAIKPYLKQRLFHVQGVFR